jgi:N4-gp56 family major capsid protein
MANVMTTAAAATATVKAAYERSIYVGLRSHLHADRVATVKPTMQTQPGSSVIFTINTDMTSASAAINESVDVDAVLLAAAQITVTLAEYGNAVEVTENLLGVSFDYPAFDRGAAERLAWNAGISQDDIAWLKLIAGTNVRYATGGATDPTARNTVEPGDVLCAQDVRRAFTDLSAADVVPFENGFYRAFLHPHTVLDLRSETGSGSWRVPAEYTPSDAQIENGSIGAFEGFEFIEASRMPIFADAGSSTTLTDVYPSLFLGREALAKAFAAPIVGEYPSIRIRPAVDKLLRFHSVGWYWNGGYAVFRQGALRRVESSSSVGAN